MVKAPVCQEGLPKRDIILASITQGTEDLRNCRTEI